MAGFFCIKDQLYRMLKKQRALYGQMYNFVPLTFILPNDYSKFVDVFTRRQVDSSLHLHSNDFYQLQDDRAAQNTISAQNGSQPSQKGLKELWICKPTDMSRGRNIFLLDNISQLNNNAYQQAMIVQRYITNPLLIQGYKWDIRIYVLVTSVSPLTIFIYEEGLVRFSTHKFSLKAKDVSDVFVHLTNSSINKGQKENEEIGPNSKWTLKQLKEFFKAQNMAYERVWAEIEKIVTLTLLQMMQSVPGSPQTSHNCFELFGFDILIDSSMKPWLLEINGPPQLTIDKCEKGSDSATTDMKVKYPMIKDMVRVLFEIDRGKIQNFCKAQSQPVSSNIYQSNERNAGGIGNDMQLPLINFVKSAKNKGGSVSQSPFFQSRPLNPTGRNFFNALREDSAQKKHQETSSSYGDFMSKLRTTEEDPDSDVEHRVITDNKKSMLKVGKFKLIFPFSLTSFEQAVKVNCLSGQNHYNKDSQNLVYNLSNQVYPQRDTSGMNSIPVMMKQLVQEVKRFHQATVRRYDSTSPPKFHTGGHTLYNSYAHQQEHGQKGCFIGRDADQTQYKLSFNNLPLPNPAAGGRQDQNRSAFQPLQDQEQHAQLAKNILNEIKKELFIGEYGTSKFRRSNLASTGPTHESQGPSKKIISTQWSNNALHTVAPQFKSHKNTPIIAPHSLNILTT